MRFYASRDIGKANDFAAAERANKSPALFTDGSSPIGTTVRLYTAMTTLPTAWCPSIRATAFAASLSG